MKLSDLVKFVVSYIKNPSQVGAICPSSRFLAQRMVRGVKRKTCKTAKGEGAVVVELGAGTGAVTKYIVKSGYAKGEFKLYSIEFDEALAEVLKSEYPDVEIVNDSAENLRKIVGGDSGKIVAIISSLPLLSLPKDCVKTILNEVEESLPIGGVFIQFTYNLARAPEKLGFKKMVHLGRSIELLNIPPARVDVFAKAE